MDTEQETTAPQQVQVDSQRSAADNANRPGVIILQWLTYAFWGWSIVSIGSLLATTLTHMISGADTSGFTPYGIAASLVLVPIAMACDFFYSKHEPEHKTGAATIVMVIHAVLFALLGIGTLIGAVFALIQLFVSGEQSDATTIALLSLGSLVLLYAATFLRTLNPPKVAWFSRVYMLLMPVVTLAVIVASVVGPLRYQSITKNDRLIVSNINTVATAVTNYADANNKLPASLSDVTLSGDAKKLVEGNLVEYTANTKPAKSRSNDYGIDSTSDKTYFYTLCVNYARPSSKGATNPGIDRYTDYLSVYQHAAGKACYKVSTSYSYVDY